MNVNLSISNGQQLPGSLLEIPFPPAAFYIKGRLIDDTAMYLAIVGTRKASPWGMAFARMIAGELASQGVVIVSGLAMGIDRAAHEGTMAVRGKTVAVLPCGIEEVYPRSHAFLARQILESGGSIVSEYPGKCLPHQGSFLQRNRLIAGLCRATLVVEAPLRSGALNTAAHALNSNRDVAAVPGSPNNPLSAGTNGLIKQGATVVTSAQDVMDLLGLKRQSSDLSGLLKTPLEASVIRALQSGPLSLADMMNRLPGIPLSEINATLSELEIRGMITRGLDDLLEAAKS